MSHTISIGQAAANLAEIIGELKAGDEIVLTRQNLPVARILPNHIPQMGRHAGSCKGMLIIHEDDDEQLKDYGW